MKKQGRLKMDLKRSGKPARNGLLWLVSGKRLKNKAFSMRRLALSGPATMLGSKRVCGGVRNGMITSIAPHKSRHPHETIVNEFESPEKPTLTSILLTGYLAMMKRILFLMLTAFVISLPVTGIWSLSFSGNSDWNEPAQNLSGPQPPRTAYLDSMNHYLQSLRFLIDGHESFGPFT